MPKNRKIHEWTKRLVHHLNRAGIRATEASLSRSRKGYYSAYFGVPGMGEVRVSDHPIVPQLSTADISISRPVSYIDLAKAFIFKHNEITGGDLTVLDQPPYIIGAAAGAELLATIDAQRAAIAAEREELERYVARRREWWAEQIAASGLEGTSKEIKYQLKSSGVRYPGAQENEE